MTRSLTRESGNGRPSRRRRRDRHGRGRRGVLAPPEVPIARSRAEQFDDLVLDAVEDLEHTWAEEIASLQFAVEEVPGPVEDEFSADVVADKGIVLAQLHRGQPDTRSRRDRRADPDGGDTGPVVVIYRRPVEARTEEGEDRADLVFSLVVELVAEWLGRDTDEIDPR
ncbi:metallopeptidase family protein [Jatrophihabitans sp. YIM 134969]